MKRTLAVIALVLLAGCGSTTQPGPSPSPGPTPSPGQSPAASPTAAPADVCHVGGVTYCVLNPAVTQGTIRQTICVAGWTKTIRPPVNYTDTLKRQQIAAFASRHPNDPNWTTGGTEEDHRMPLDLGGDPRDSGNLSPEEPPSPNPKDHDEADLGGSQGRVCRGEMTLAQAQQQMVSTWLGPYPDYAH